MANYVIWMDSEKAQIFNLKTSGIEKSHVNKETIDHHTHNKKDAHQDPGVQHYYKDLAIHIKDGEEVLIMGPGLAKNHFKTHLETHNAGLAKKIVGVENSDHPTENQIMATARKFFKHYHLFNNPI